MSTRAFAKLIDFKTTYYSLAAALQTRSEGCDSHCYKSTNRMIEIHLQQQYSQPEKYSHTFPIQNTKDILSYIEMKMKPQAYRTERNPPSNRRGYYVTVTSSTFANLPITFAKPSITQNEKYFLLAACHQIC